jgi:hypothetical protein
VHRRARQHARAAPAALAAAPPHLERAVGVGAAIQAGGRQARRAGDLRGRRGRGGAQLLLLLLVVVVVVLLLLQQPRGAEAPACASGAAGGWFRGLPRAHLHVEAVRLQRLLHAGRLLEQLLRRGVEGRLLYTSWRSGGGWRRRAPGRPLGALPQRSRRRPGEGCWAAAAGGGRGPRRSPQLASGAAQPASAAAHLHRPCSLLWVDKRVLADHGARVVLAHRDRALALRPALVHLRSERGSEGGERARWAVAAPGTTPTPGARRLQCPLTCALHRSLWKEAIGKHEQQERSCPSSAVLAARGWQAGSSSMQPKLLDRFDLVRRIGHAARAAVALSQASGTTSVPVAAVLALARLGACAPCKVSDAVSCSSGGPVVGPGGGQLPRERGAGPAGCELASGGSRSAVRYPPARLPGLPR